MRSFTGKYQYCLKSNYKVRKSRDQDSIIISIRKNYEKKIFFCVERLLTSPKLLERMTSGFLPLLLFAIVMVGTPGPANMLLMTSGANFGFWRSVPFVSGVALGKLLINALLGLGLWEILSTYSEVLFALKMVSVAYLAWLALRMSGFLLKKRELKQAESFWKGLAVHPLNPKAWAMLVFAYGHFSVPSQSLLEQTLVISGTFLGVQIVFHSLWCAGGALVVRLLAGKPAERWLMRGLSLCTVLIVIWAVALDGSI